MLGGLQVNLEGVPRYNSGTGNLEVNGVPIVISGSMPSNAVVIDAVTGLFETYSGDQIAEAFVDTMIDALALTGAAYDDQSLIVKNAGNNLSNYFPVEIFRMN